MACLGTTKCVCDGRGIVPGPERAVACTGPTKFEYLSPRQDLELLAEAYGEALDAGDHALATQLAMQVAGPRFVNAATALLLAMCGRSDPA